MTDMPVSPTVDKLTLEDFVRLYDTEGPFELVDGERRKLPPTVLGHNEASDSLKTALSKHGQAYTEAPFVLTYTSDWVTGSLVPDAMFIASERFEAYKATDPEWREKPLVLVPDLVVEVISRNDSYSDVTDKVERYLSLGVKIVLVVDRHHRRVMVYRPDGTQLRLSENDTLTLYDLIPEFEYPIAKIFA